jgi:hypothetical protein
MTAAVRWPAIHAEQLNGLELLATFSFKRKGSKDRNFTIKEFYFNFCNCCLLHMVTGYFLRNASNHSFSSCADNH